MPATLKVRRKAHLTASTECLISAAPTGLSRVMRLLGALLGSGAAYLALAAGHRSDICVLSQVPVLDLTITCCRRSCRRRSGRLGPRRAQTIINRPAGTRLTR